MGSRIALLIVGLLAVGLLGSGLAVQKGNLTYHTQAPMPLEIWARWDAAWYLLIAEEGYQASEAFAHLPRYEPEATAGFFPLYPLLIRATAPIVGGIGAGVLISNVCLAGSLLLLFRLTRDETGGDDGDAAWPRGVRRDPGVPGIALPVGRLPRGPLPFSNPARLRPGQDWRLRRGRACPASWPP